jgi:hypothetical protein
VWWARFWRQLRRANAHSRESELTRLLDAVEDAAREDGTDAFEPLGPRATAAMDRVAVYLGMEPRP